MGRALRPLNEKIDKWSVPEPNSGCWIWMGKIDRWGYGQIEHQGRYRKAATVAYELTKGLVPQGLEVSHLCHQRWCINPDHLVAETHSENCQRRPFYIRKHVCSEGHPLVWMEERKQRGCPVCYTATKQAYREANRDKAAAYRAANRESLNEKRKEHYYKMKGQCNGNQSVI